jgi:hypothetical protein
LTPLRPVCVEAYSEYPPLGLFVVREDIRARAVGIITRVRKRKKNGELVSSGQAYILGEMKVSSGRQQRVTVKDGAREESSSGVREKEGVERSRDTEKKEGAHTESSQTKDPREGDNLVSGQQEDGDGVAMSSPVREQERKGTPSTQKGQKKDAERKKGSSSSSTTTQTEQTADPKRGKVRALKKDEGARASTTSTVSSSHTEESSNE